MPEVDWVGPAPHKARVATGGAVSTSQSLTQFIWPLEERTRTYHACNNRRHSSLYLVSTNNSMSNQSSTTFLFPLRTLNSNLVPPSASLAFPSLPPSLPLSVPLSFFSISDLGLPLYRVPPSAEFCSRSRFSLFLARAC